MKASIIIPVYNGMSYLRTCLSAVLAQTEADFSIIAVENGSNDGSERLITTEFPTVTLERSDKPLGFAGAVNHGIRRALTSDAEAIVILNQDTEVQAGWLTALLNRLRADAQIGVVGCKALFPNGLVQHAGGQLLLPLGYGQNRLYNQPDSPDMEGGSNDFLSGVALALRRTMLEQIGLFDESFNPAYFEDVDLCLRARSAGWKLAYEPAAVLVHHEGATRSTGDYAHAALIERNRIRLRLKHASLAELRDQFFPAEANHLKERARNGGVHVLRRAYLDGLLMLAELERPDKERAAIRTALADLRQEAITLERSITSLRDDTSDSHIPQSNNSEPHAATPRVQIIDRRAPTPPPVAIIMLTWNGLDYTKECLESLRALTAEIEYQVIVVDNGSTDGTREYLRDLEWVHLIENETNVGYVRGNNQGIAAAPADWDLVLLNNDMRILQANWLARLQEVAHSEAANGVVGCRLLMSNGRLLHAGTYMPTDSFWGWQIGGGEEDIGQYTRVREVDGIVGACMYIRRDVITQIGGLDERFFSYYEDTDYCLRAQQAGYKIMCAGDVTMIHHENVSTKLNNVNFWAMYSKSQGIFLDRWRDYYRSHYQHRLFWHSLVSAPTGYATSSRQLLLSLDRQAVDIRLAYLYGTDFSERSSGDPRIEQMRQRPKDTSLVQVVYNQGDAFHKNSGSYRIGFTMLEVTGIPDDWVRQSNLMDEIWVPSSFNAETFHNSGVVKPIHVIPLGIDPDFFHPGIKAKRFSEKFTFLSVFEWGERKAPELLLKAYCAAFSAQDDVLLVLKVDNRDGDVNVAQQIASLNLPTDGPQIVVLYNQELPGYQLGSLYRSADCFVTATRGEGWGMPILEAMACGLPTIATNWSAQTDFMRDDLCYLVEVERLIPAVAKCPYYVGYQWAEARLEHLIHQMRQVYEQRDEAAARGARAAEVVAHEWTWDRAAEKIVARLRAIGV